MAQKRIPVSEYVGSWAQNPADLAFGEAPNWARDYNAMQQQQGQMAALQSGQKMYQNARIDPSDRNFVLFDEEDLDEGMMDPIMATIGIALGGMGLEAALGGAGAAAGGGAAAGSGLSASQLAGFDMALGGLGGAEGAASLGATFGGGAAASGGGGLLDWFSNAASNVGNSISNGVSSLFGGGGNALSGTALAEEIAALTGSGMATGGMGSMAGGGLASLFGGGGGNGLFGNLGAGDFLKTGLNYLINQSGAKDSNEFMNKLMTQSSALDQPQRAPFQQMGLNLLQNPQTYFQNNPFATSMANFVKNNVMPAQMGKSGNPGEVIDRNSSQFATAVGGNYNELANILMGYGGFNQGPGYGATAAASLFPGFQRQQAESFRGLGDLAEKAFPSVFGNGGGGGGKTNSVSGASIFPV